MSEQNVITESGSGGSSSRCWRTVLAALTVLLLSALLVQLIPSSEEMGLKRVQQLLDEGNPADALLIADKVLNEVPESKPLKVIAIKAAQAQLTSLVANEDFKGAGRWLSRQLEEKPYLEALHSELMRLDARDAVADLQKIAHYREEARPEPLRQLLDKYNASASLPRFVESLLRPLLWRDETRYWLLSTALERGHKLDERGFNTLLQLLNSVEGDGVIATLQKYDGEALQGWANQALNDGGMMAFYNAWQVLQGSGDARLSDPYYQSLHRMVNINDVMVLDQSRRILQGQVQRGRQVQIMLFLDELLARHAERITNQPLLEEVKRMHSTLNQEWQ